MAVEIRIAQDDDDLEQAYAIMAYAFTGDRSPEARQRLRHLEEMGLTMVLLEDGEMVACLRVLALEMLVSGGPIALGGVCSVACLPERRRQGHVGRLLRRALEEMRERGQALSSLYTPHPPLYRRYGWMVAGAALKHTWSPKLVQPYRSAAPAGRAERVGEDAQPVLKAIYQRFTAGRNGYLVRSQRWWKEAVFRQLFDDRRRLNDVAVWRDDSGSATGYVVYRPHRESRTGEPPVDSLFLSEFVALDAGAYGGLLRYLLAHDLAQKVTWYAPPDEPLALALDGSELVRREYHDTFMLRVVDMERAVAARPAGPGAPEGTFTVHVVDAAAPWNQGTWRIESGGGALRAARTREGACISTDAATFAALYNGFMPASVAVRCGLAEASDEGAVALADRVLAAAYVPYSPDQF